MCTETEFMAHDMMEYLGASIERGTAKVFFRAGHGQSSVLITGCVSVLTEAAAVGREKEKDLLLFLKSITHHPPTGDTLTHMQ